MRDIGQVFQPQGNTQAIALATTASPALQISAGSQQGVRIRTGNNTFQCLVAIGTSAVAAEAGSTSATFDSFVMGTSEVLKLSVGPNAWISAITTGTTATVQWVFITPGYGA